MWQLKSARKSTSFVSLIVVWVCLWCLNLVWCKKVWLPQRVAIWTLDFIPGLVRRQISNFKKKAFLNLWGLLCISLICFPPNKPFTFFLSFYFHIYYSFFFSSFMGFLKHPYMFFFCFFGGVWLPQNNQMVQIKNKKRRVVQTGAHSNLNLFEGKERLFSFTVPFLDGFKHSFLFIYLFLILFGFCDWYFVNVVFIILPYFVFCFFSR